MDRRRYLSLIAGGSVGAIAGCLSDGERGSSPEQSGTATDTPVDDRTTTDEPTTTAASVDVETPAPGECDAETPPHPDTRPGLPDPWSYPEKPATMEREPVTDFLEEYEATYRYNGLLGALDEEGNCAQYIERYATGSSVSSAGDGFTASVSTRGAYSGEVCETVTGTDTPTPLPHADFPEESSSYYVTDRFLIREGTVVECW